MALFRDCVAVTSGNELSKLLTCRGARQTLSIQLCRVNVLPLKRPAKAAVNECRSGLILGIHLRDGERRGREERRTYSDDKPTTPY